MNALKITCFSLFILLSSFALNAQGTEPNPPVFKISYSNTNPKTGDIIEIIFKADIPDDLHMYSTYNKCDIGPLKLQFIFSPSTSFCTVGEPYSIGDKKIKDEIFNCDLGEFFKKAEVRQKIKILSSNVSIKGTIEGQWCTESVCYNFGGLIPMQFSSTLKASGSPVKCDDKVVVEPILTSSSHCI